MKYIFFLVNIMFISSVCFAQGIKGKITNHRGNAIPFATIYSTSDYNGTTSNINGNYNLDLSKGKYKIQIQYLGYKTKVINVSISDSTEILNIVLEEQIYKIPEVRILASGEDPAYGIMRKVIALSTYYLNQVEEYSCRVYLKGTGNVVKIPRLLKRQLKKDGLEEGKCFVTENITDINFTLPNSLKQKVISLRSSGEGNNISPMNFVSLSLYNDINGITSPISKSAFANYRYKLDGSFYDRNFLIHKIKVIPKHKGFDVYSGYIFIVDSFWCLHSVELKIEQNMFTADINQIYAPVKFDVWMPISHDFKINAKVVGINFLYNYVASVSDYKLTLNTKIDNSIFQSLKNDYTDKKKVEDDVYGATKKDKVDKKEILSLVKKDDLSKKESKKLNRLIREKVKKSASRPPLKIENRHSFDDSASLRTVSYWNSIRPIPLTVNEKDSYKAKDSIQTKIENNPEYEDSVRLAKQKMKFGDIFFGNRYSYSENTSSFSFSGLFKLENFNFNTVDGLLITEKFEYRTAINNGRNLEIENNVRYAVSRERMLADLKVNYTYNGLKRAIIKLDAGRKTSDFNSGNGIPPNLNLLTSLFLKQNHMKLYEKDFTKINHKIDIVNGLTLETDFEFAKRHQLKNNTDFYLTNPFKDNYTENIPQINNFDNQLIANHTASIINIGLSYTPRYFYKILGKTKQMMYSKYPTFSVNYTKGISNFLNSDVDFDRLETAINHSFSQRQLGRIKYKFIAGKFLNTNKLYFADYKHYNTNNPFLITSNTSFEFRLPDYYKYSTSRTYFEGHIKLTNNRILVKRLPIISKTVIKENLYFNILKNQGQDVYYEFGYGVNQILLLFNFEVFAGFEKNKHVYTGIKIGIPFVGKGNDEISIGAN